MEDIILYLNTLNKKAPFKGRGLNDSLDKRIAGATENVLKASNDDILGFEILEDAKSLVIKHKPTLYDEGERNESGDSSDDDKIGKNVKDGKY